MFNCTPCAPSSLIKGSVDSERVLVMGIFTYTFLPQAAILSACRFISENSSEKTSKEIGLVVTLWRISFANAS